jgi:hypothetical protein
VFQGPARNTETAASVAHVKHYAFPAGLDSFRNQTPLFHNAVAAPLKTVSDDVSWPKAPENFPRVGSFANVNRHGQTGGASRL